MQPKQNSKDSDVPSFYQDSQKMKISLFYKPSIMKVCSLFLSLSFVVGVPLQANADFLDSVKSILGADTLAAEDFSTGTVLNSQTLPLIESSVPDMKNAVDNEVGGIVEEDALSTDGGFVGSGLESVSDGNVTEYTVKEGDTLSQIAEDFNISTNTIRWANGFTGGNIKVGQKLDILPVTGVKHIIKKGDTLAGIANKYDADSDEISIYNGIADNTLKIGNSIIIPNGVINNAPAKPANTSKTSNENPSSSSKVSTSGYYLRPASGKITSPYGSRWGSFHYGIDIGNARGTAVYAAASGKVVKVVSFCKEGQTSCGGRYGNYIMIEHPNGQRTIYAHLQKVSVSVGQSVKQGKQIGTIGNTGRSTGPHLHFQIEKANGATIKPAF